MGFLNKDFDSLEKKPAVDEPTPINYDYRIDEADLVSFVKKLDLPAERYADFIAEKYPHSLNFYDFEVFLYDWCVTIINPIENRETIICNNKAELKRYYREHRDEVWVGYNSRNYDVFILKGILLGMNPKKINDDLVIKGLKGWQISEDFKSIKLVNFDIYTKNSLKVIEGFMGADIRETEVDFNLNRKLTRLEMRKTVKYNIHDVEQTIEVFRRNKYLYDSQTQIVELFDLPIEYIGYTQAQLTARVLECKPQERDDEFDISIVPCLHLHKYKSAEDWFRNKANLDYKKSFAMEVCGVPHQFGWGGLHGCPEKPLHVKGRLFHVDVTSYYPSMMIVYDFLTRNTKDKSRYKMIYDTRVALKKAGKKKEQAPYKVILNATYGITKDRFSLAYDPVQANNICVNGQLMLLDLLEHLEPYITLIQSNTDGLIIQVDDDQQKIDKVMDICHRWEHRTGMGLGTDEITEIYQKDVNNYVFRFANGKLERKGAYVMEIDDLSYDLPIVNKALVAYMMENVPVRRTINGCDDLREFQKIVKVSNVYKGGWHNGEYLTDKTFRVFASKSRSDTYLGKYKKMGATIEKFGNTPEHCFIMNEAVLGVKVPANLDRDWYIRLAEKRLEDFGIKQSNDLFDF